MGVPGRGPSGWRNGRLGGCSPARGWCRDVGCHRQGLRLRVSVGFQKAYLCTRYVRAALTNSVYVWEVNSGSGKSLKNCLSSPATLFTSWWKFSGFVKSTWEESVASSQRADN